MEFTLSINKNNLKETTANKGLAIAGGTSKVHVLCFDRNLYFS
jgi:hypothetical protein